MPLYDDLEYRPRPVRLEAERRIDLGDLALEAAQAGALGGAVGGNVGRAGLSYEDWLGDAPPPSFTDAEIARIRAAGADRGLRVRKLPPDSSPGGYRIYTDDPIRRRIDGGWRETPAVGRARGLVDELGEAGIRSEFHRLGGSPDHYRGGGNPGRLVVSAAPEAVPLSRAARAAQFAKGAGRAALNPASILADAAIGSTVGAGSAVAGYESARPRSSGLFTAPGPGYEELFTTEDIDRISAAKQRRKEALRQQYIDEINNKYGFGTIGPGARIEEISEYLGPVYWPTGGWGQ